MKKFTVNNKTLYVCYQNSDLDAQYKSKFESGKRLNYEDIINLNRLGIVINKKIEQINNKIMNGEIVVLPAHYNSKEKKYISSKYNIPITAL